MELCHKRGLIYQNEKSNMLISKMEFLKDYKGVLELAKRKRLNVNSFCEKQLSCLFSSNLDDLDCKEKVLRVLSELNINKFYNFACQARQYRRSDIGNHIILQEKNFKKKLDYFLRYKDNIFLQKYIKEETDHLFLQLLF